MGKCTTELLQEHLDRPKFLATLYEDGFDEEGEYVGSIPDNGTYHTVLLGITLIEDYDFEPYPIDTVTIGCRKTGRVVRLTYHPGKED